MGSHTALLNEESFQENQSRTRGGTSRASTSFTDYPSDILLEILGDLDLWDTFSFLSVCTAFRNLGNSRFLWIDVLKRTECFRPLPIPVGTDINDFNLIELQKIAWRTHHLEINWIVYPEIRRVADLRLRVPVDGQRTNILSVIPGTPLVLVYQERTCRLILCDFNADNVRVLKRMDLERPSCSALYDKLGVHLVALFTDAGGASERSLCVLGVEYGKEGGANLEEYFSAPSTISCQSLFICENIVGVIPHSGGETFLRVHITNFVTKASAIISIEVGSPINHRSRPACYVCNATPYIVTNSNHCEFEVYHCPTNRLPSTVGGPQNLEGDIIERSGALVQVSGVDDGEYHNDSFETAKVWWSPMGLHAITVMRYDRYDHGTYIRFWPKGEEDEPPERCYLEGSPAYFNGRDSPWPMASSPSGNYAVIILDWMKHSSSPPITTLYLITFLAGPGAIKSLCLDLPPTISSRFICSVGIDERCGVVYLTCTNGRLLAVSYV
ncbi:hypothetical protein BD779DRAFT_1151265 [Infundibulicybe gibba]|nr:hypothetical protein BD779DRAFT_1151265 [Infundibulicybe gibba]